MSATSARLRLYAEILTLIEQRRAESGDASLGESIERVIVDSQFRDIEGEILENPGAFEPWLIRRRPD